MKMVHHAMLFDCLALTEEAPIRWKPECFVERGLSCCTDSIQLRGSPCREAKVKTAVHTYNSSPVPMERKNSIADNSADVDTGFRE